MRATARGAAVVATGLLGLVLAGCGAGQDALTAETRPSVAGVNGRTADGSVLVRNAQVPFDAAGYDTGGRAPVQLWLFNETDAPVRLSEATSTRASMSVEDEVEIAPDGSATATLQASDLRLRLDVTEPLPLTLSFDNGAELSLEVPVSTPDEALPREPMVFEEEH